MSVLHGTGFAERHHRSEGQWPCRKCLNVRVEIEQAVLARFGQQALPKCQRALAELDERWVWWTRPERVEAARACLLASNTLGEFAALTALEHSLAAPLRDWLTAQDLIESTV